MSEKNKGELTAENGTSKDDQTNGDEDQEAMLITSNRDRYKLLNDNAIGSSNVGIGSDGRFQPHDEDLDNQRPNDAYNSYKSPNRYQHRITIEADDDLAPPQNNQYPYTLPEDQAPPQNQNDNISDKYLRMDELYGNQQHYDGQVQTFRSAR